MKKRHLSTEADFCKPAERSQETDHRASDTFDSDMAGRTSAIAILVLYLSPATADLDPCYLAS